MNADSFDLIGIDLGGTKLAAARFRPGMERIHEHRVPVAGLDQDGLVAAILDAIQTCRDAADGQVGAVGLGLPTTIDRRTGMVVSACNLPLHELPIVELVEERTDLACALDNDATAALVGEHALGRARGLEHVVMLTLGTGVGGGMLLDGRPYSGAIGGGSELGHVSIAHDGLPCTSANCPNRGCLEAYCSGTALARNAREAARQHPDGALGRAVAAGREPRGELVVELALQGDGQCVALLEELGRYLGVGIASLTNIFNPEMVVVGGGLAEAAEQWILPAAREVVQARTLEPARSLVRIEPAELGNGAGLVGAAVLARGALDASLARA